MGLGISGWGINDTLRYHFQERIDYGVMNSCLVKPALYLVQANLTDWSLFKVSNSSPFLSPSLYPSQSVYFQRTSPRVRLAEVMAEPKKENESPKGEKLWKAPKASVSSYLTTVWPSLNRFKWLDNHIFGSFSGKVTITSSQSAIWMLASM